MANLPYGFIYNENKIAADMQKAKVISLIYDAYLCGSSLEGIVATLHEKKISSPSGKAHWSTGVLFVIF